MVSNSLSVQVDKNAAKIALVIGESEVAQGQVIVKDLLAGVEQQFVALDDIVAHLSQVFN